MDTKHEPDKGTEQHPGGSKKERFTHEQQQLDERLVQIRHKVMVLSGKGGVGKSTVAANLAISLALAGKQVGLLDVDIHGPSIPRLFGLEGQTASGTQDGLIPINYRDNLKIMSVGFLLPHLDDAVIWRGPLKYSLIKQFLKDVQWGVLDYLIVDSPPGTGDEPLSIAQLIKDPDGAVIVTTPQELALIDVRKSIEFCRVLNVPVLGVIENMSGFVCPHCQTRVDIFKSGGGQTMAENMMVPFLGRIPIEPDLVKSSDDGVPFLFQHPDSETARALQLAIMPILKLSEVAVTKKNDTVEKSEPEKEITMPEKATNQVRIAIPVSGQRLSPHFGHCEEFFLADVDLASRSIIRTQAVAAPPHQPGTLPVWLQQQGGQVIIAGGMGERAKSMFEERGIQVIIGAAAEPPEKIIRAYLDQALELGEDACDHGDHSCQDHDHGPCDRH